MKREQAVNIVKKLVANHLITATWLSIEKRETGGYVEITPILFWVNKR